MSGTINSSGIQSHTAAIAKPKGDIGKIGWALMAISIAVSFVPIFGPGVAYFIDRRKNSMEATASKQALVDWYRPQIAAQLGIPVEKVRYEDLMSAAQYNPTFRHILAKIDEEQDKGNRGALVTAMVATPMSAVGLGGAVDAAGKLVVSGGEMVVAGGAGIAASTLGKDKLTVEDVSNTINEKRVAGQAVDASDVFMLRLAHDEELQDKIKENYGARFHKMTPEQQQAAMKMLPDITVAAEAEAHALNEGMISEQELVFITSEQPSDSGFASRVRKAPGVGSFRDKINAGRAAANDAQHQITA